MVSPGKREFWALCDGWRASCTVKFHIILCSNTEKSDQFHSTIFYQVYRVLFVLFGFQSVKEIAQILYSTIFVIVPTSVMIQLKLIQFLKSVYETLQLFQIKRIFLVFVLGAVDFYYNPRVPKTPLNRFRNSDCSQVSNIMHATDIDKTH